MSDEKMRDEAKDPVCAPSCEEKADGLRGAIRKTEDFLKDEAKTTGLTFGEALSALKAGMRVTRAGWNGRGMYLWLKPSTVIRAEWCKDPILKELAEANGGEILGLATVCMYTHDSTGRKAILTGWLASQSDMTLEDWQIWREPTECPKA